jgi:hypothetical protein
MVFRGEVRPVLAGESLLLLLSRHSAIAPLVRRCFLGRGRTHLDAAPSPVVAHPVHGSVADDRAVNIGVVDHGRVHTHNRGVVTEVAAAPASPVKAHSGIAKAVVHAAIEAYLRSPVARIPEVAAITPAPVARGPEKAHCGSHYPRSGNPIIAAGTIPGPVARGPHVVGSRANWLLVDRQFRGSHVD